MSGRDCAEQSGDDLDGALRFTDKEMLAHILAVKAGQYDHLIPEGTEL
ncbi:MULTISPECIES: hypothetical protein [unclassified Streptomyces]